MRAILFRRHGGLENLELVDDYPDPVMEDSDCVVRVGAVALNGFDPQVLSGIPGLRTPLPMIPCGDIAGEVVAVGASVKERRVGDAVSIVPFLDGKIMGETARGGCREFISVPERSLLPLPAGLSAVEAAALPIAYGTAWRMLSARGNLKRGERLLVVSATGGVGVACVQFGKMLGAEVVACGTGSWKLDRLRELGADHAFDLEKEDIVSAIHGRFGKPRHDGGGGVDLAVNFTGGEAWVPTLRSLRRGGRLLTCGATAGHAPAEDLRYVFSYELNVHGSSGWTIEDQAKVLELAASQKMKPAIHAIRPMVEYPIALGELMARKVIGKSIITL